MTNKERIERKKEKYRIRYEEIKEIQKYLNSSDYLENLRKQIMKEIK
jgi:hypothetical protein